MHTHHRKRPFPPRDRKRYSGLAIIVGLAILTPTLAAAQESTNSESPGSVGPQPVPEDADGDERIEPVPTDGDSEDRIDAVVPDDDRNETPSVDNDYDERSDAIAPDPRLTESTAPAVGDVDPAPQDIELVDHATLGCDIDGRPAMCDGVWFGDADAKLDQISAQQDRLTLEVSAVFNSTFFVNVAEATATGGWKLSGDWVMNAITAGGIGQGTATVESTGDGVIVGDAHLLTIDGRMSNLGRFESNGFGQPISNTHPMPTLEAKVVGGNCVEMVGEWSFSWGEIATEFGWEASDRVTGGFSAVRNPGYEEEAFDELFEAFSTDTLTPSQIDAAPTSAAAKEVIRARLAFSDWRRTLPEPSDESIGQFIGHLERVEAAINLLRNEEGCETTFTEDGLEVLTGFLAKGPHTLDGWLGRGVGDVSMPTLRRFVNAATRVGSFGPGSTIPPAQQQSLIENLRPHIETAVDKVFVLGDGVMRWRKDTTRRDSAAGILGLELALDVGLDVSFDGAPAVSLDGIAAEIRDEAAKARNWSATGEGSDK